MFQVLKLKLVTTYEVIVENDLLQRSVAQLVEHRSPKPGAGGSSPSSPAILLIQIQTRMNPFQKIRTFYKETIAELGKASWPTLPELRESTVVVIAGVAILGLFISVSDFSLTNCVELLTLVIRS